VEPRVRGSAVRGFTRGGLPSLLLFEHAPILTDAFRWGGRATIEAWIGSRLRLFASYELSSRIDLAPEISGFKSLRLIMEGVY